MYNANNYGYNPYGTYIPQRPMQQPLQNTAENYQSLQNTAVQPVNNSYKLNGKIVDSIETAKANGDFLLDGSVSYYPLASGEAIVTKQLQMDGTSKITIFKPFKDDIKEVPKYLIQEDLDDIKDEINDLKQEIKDMKKAKKKDE